jgi:hypothetical protein
MLIKAALLSVPRRRSGTKKRVRSLSEPYLRDGWSMVQGLAEQITERIRAKSAKGYGSDTVLIVGAVPNSPMLHAEWQEAVRRIVEADVHRSFAEVFVVDRRFSFCTTLPK